MKTDGKKNKSYIGYLICILCFGLTIWAFYPGFMSPDSIANLADGRSGEFHDINSPVMSYLWGKLDAVFAGPALMLMLQNAIFWSAAACLWRATHKRSFRLGLCLILFTLLPNIFSQLPVIWKDVGLGASLFLAAALLYLADKTINRVAFFASILFLFYGFAARLNALPAILPLAIWSGFVFRRLFEIKTGATGAQASPLASSPEGDEKSFRASRLLQARRLRSSQILLGAGYFIALSAAVYFVNWKITEGRTVYPFQQVYLYDLAAISSEKDEALFPEYVLKDGNFSLGAVKMRYNERSVADLIFENTPNQGDLPVLKLSADEAEISALRQKWLETIAANPLLYLKHRGRVFAQLIGLSPSVTRPFWDFGFSQNPPEFRSEGNFATKVLMKYFGIFQRPFPQTFFFRAFLWLLAVVYFLYRSIKSRLKGDWEIVFVLSTSCLLFTFAYFPTTPSTEFRYLFWPAISSAIVVIFGTYLLWREKAEKKDFCL